MRHRLPWIITSLLLLYRLLLTLAPDEFADEYSDPALQILRQCCLDAYNEHGARGVLRLWFPTLIDALGGILAEQSITLKRVFGRPRLIWLVAFALSCVLFPFSWLSRVWIPFGDLFHLILATPQAYLAGHIILFGATGLILLFSLPDLRKHPQLYILCLMLAALVEEAIQVLVNAHPGLHKDASNLLLDLCGILLASLLLRVWQSQLFSARA